MNSQVHHLTRAVINLDHLTHNLRLLQELVGNRPLWPAIKANAYGHGIEIIACHLVGLGYRTLCVAHVTEAMELLEAGIQANYVLFSASLPEHSEAIIAHHCEPAVCTLEMVESLAQAADRLGKKVAIHVMVDTGMGRIGIQPEEVPAFLMRCQDFHSVRVKGLMSHFPCADEADKTLSNEEIECFNAVIEATKDSGIELHHMANSAAIFDLSESLFDAARPGISIYGLMPSAEIINPRVCELKPVLEWKTRITFLKEVPAGVGLSYGHAFHTKQPSLIATIPIGYGDGLSRKHSNNLEVLVRGVRCPQVGRITMDQSLIDVTALRGKMELGDEVVIIGQQGEETITADDLATKLGTINYEIVTQISQRVPRIVESE
jgi:alanine racemase